MMIIRDYLLEIVLAIFSLTLLLLSILPYFSGFKIQSDYAQLIGSVSKNTGLIFEVVSFEKHWFSSNAELMVKDRDDQLLYKFKHKIIHGPLYLGLLLDGRSPIVSMVIKGAILPAKIDQSFLSKILSANPVQVSAYVSFNGDDEAAFLLPPINEKIDGVTIQTGTINFDLKYYSQENRFKGDVTIPSLLLYEQSHMEIEHFILNFDETISNNDVAGDVVLSFDALKIKLMHKVFNMKSVSTRLRNSIANGLLNLELDINASKVNLFNEQINSLSFDLGVENLDIGNIKKDITFFTKNKLYFENGFDIAKYEFDVLKMDHFNFFSEHGTFSASILMKNSGEKGLNQTNYLATKNTTLGVTLSAALFNRIYEIVFSNIGVPVKKADVVIKNMLKLHYLDKNLDKFKMNLSGKGNVFIINDQRVGFDELSNNLMLNIFSNY